VFPINSSVKVSSGTTGDARDEDARLGISAIFVVIKIA
jgi:hypothetical protein